ncbi:hypothetical protein Tco_0245368, partial [Tanacetum coccineum]
CLARMLLIDLCGVYVPVPLEAVVADLSILSPNSLWTASSPTFFRGTTRLRKYPFDSDAFRGQPFKELLPQIHQELEHRMEEMGIDLPSGISVEYFTYHVLLGKDEAGVLDPTFLTEVLADLQQPSHIVSWY